MIAQAPDCLATKVLLVEDSVPQIDMFKQAIEKVSHLELIHVAEDGEAAMRFLQMEDAERPDIVVLDLEMPKKSGFEVLKDIRRTDELKHLPVVIMTANSQSEKLFEAYRLGANEFVTKPATLDELVNVLQRLGRSDPRESILTIPTEQPNQKRAIVIDDEPDVTEFIEGVLRSKGYDVRCGFDGDEAISLTNEFRPHVVFLDINIPVQDGWLVCNKIKLQRPAPFIVLITGETRPDLYEFAAFVHADDLMKKPFEEWQIQRTLDELEEIGRASA